MDNDRSGQTPGYDPSNSPYGQDQYGQSPYGQQPGYQSGMQHYPGYGNAAQGQKHRTTAVVLGIVGLFVLGIVLGPLALWQAGKAERLGVKATAGKVLGWIALVGSLIGMFVLFGGGLQS